MVLENKRPSKVYGLIVLQRTVYFLDLSQNFHLNMIFLLKWRIETKKLENENFSAFTLVIIDEVIYDDLCPLLFEGHSRVPDGSDY